MHDLALAGFDPDSQQEAAVAFHIRMAVMMSSAFPLIITAKGS